VTSLGDKLNTEDGSVKAVAGSHYNYHPYDDKSVHSSYMYGSGSYHEDGASVKCLPGSVLDNTSDTTSARFAHSVAPVHNEEHASTSQACGESRMLSKSNSCNNEEPPKRYRILNRQRTKSRSPSNSQISFRYNDCSSNGGADILVTTSDKGVPCSSAVASGEQSIRTSPRYPLEVKIKSENERAQSKTQKRLPKSKKLGQTERLNKSETHLSTQPKKRPNRLLIGSVKNADSEETETPTAQRLLNANSITPTGLVSTPRTADVESNTPSDKLTHTERKKAKTTFFSRLFGGRKRSREVRASQV
jgi:hypothetical protein